MRLLERDAELTSLRDGVRQAMAGHGVGIAVAGESGAGKSAVVATALADVGRDIRVFRGHCEPLQTPRPLGPFRGLGLSEIDAQPGVSVVRVSELCDRVYSELSAQPTVLLIEDLHWLDEVSAELLRFLARRVEAAPLALVVTYRDLEIDPRHPARPLLGDFASLEGLRSLLLRPLSVDAVRELTAGTILDPGRVHAVTGGNPFFVTAVAREPDLPMPGSVRDAVLARIAEVVPEDLEVLQLVATAPDSLDDRVLPSLGVDLPTLRRLDHAALLTRTAQGLAFRHELARQAVLSTVPPGGAGLLHTRLLDSLERLEPRDPAVLTHHAVGARDNERAVRYARIAAAEAIAASSHSEAAAFTEIALTNLPTAALPAERAGLLALLTRQLYLTNRLADAIAAARASIPLWDVAGELAGVADAHAALAVLEYQVGHRRSCNEHAAKACEIAEASGSPATIAHAHADAAMLAVAGSELAEASVHAARTLTAATEAGLRELSVAGHMMAEAGACLAGDAAARGRLLEWTEAARRDGWDELAWRGYLVVFLADFEWCNLRGAQRLVDDALDYVTDRDLAVARHWHLAFRSLLHLCLGRWSAAREDAERVRTEVAAGSIVPGYVLGLTALRCADRDAPSFLDDMWAKARGLDEPLRYLTSLCALAEAMWMTGRPDSRVTEFGASQLAKLGSTPDTRGSAGRLRVWLRRLGLEADRPRDVAEPYRLVLDGQYALAASWWRSAGDVFSEAMAFADSPDPEHRMHAVSLLDRAGAIGTADRLRVELRQEGLLMVPQRPRESTRINPGGLTNRQLDVARLVARGLSNGEIAAQLYISPKTADHHVSAILAKLQLTSRRAVVTRAAELGLS